jgi:hypothetical protein
MTRWVVDTNVPVVANGNEALAGQRPSLTCREAAVKFLLEVSTKGKVVVDMAGAIQDEYRRNLNPAGQPGVGDRFLHLIFYSDPKIVERVDLLVNDDGQYSDLPPALIESGFDPSDRKFAALACKENISVVNAVDSDWIEHAQILVDEEISVRHLCGCDPHNWFQ